MSSTWTINGIQYSHGPDVNIGGTRCPEHHEGVREGLSDYCCCCDPCRYVRPPDAFLIPSCCRCVPRLLCISFVPDVGSLECCNSQSTAIPPVFVPPGDNDWDYRVTYTGSIGGIDLTVSLMRLVEDGPCFWVIESESQSIYETIQIDHVNVTCLSLPEVSVGGVVDTSGCVGTIAFGVSDMKKVPFQKELNQPPLRMITPTWQGGEPQCNCTSVPETLCVDGVRHRGEARERVQFTWNEDLGDRWSYLPCNGNISTDQEHIYLRGDHYGNCYLEFDSEQSGDTTNDWAVIPNTFDIDNPHEIRTGMIPIDSCGCDIYAYSEVPEIATIEYPTSRFIHITAGRCGCWQYRCGTCRCVPNKVCVTGAIDGQTVIADGFWDGTGWAVAADGYTPAFRVVIGPNECGECALTCEGDFSIPFAESQAVECGDGLTGEMYSEYNEESPLTYNWLWVTAAPCDCHVSPCFLCIDERCGGMPEILYYDITTQAQFVLNPPELFCNITVELHYFKRFFGMSRQLICGYIGHTVVYCPPDESHANARTTVIRVSIISGGPGAFTYQVDMADLSAASPGPLVFTPVFGNTNRPAAQIISCDPFVADTGWYSMPVNCRWGCADIPSSEQPTNMREMFTE